jgi:hypothetical protein
VSPCPDRPVPLPFSTFVGFGGLVGQRDNILWIRIPYWLLTLMNGLVLTLLVRRRHVSFSLRTLLIATTLVAVVLGIVAAAR